MEFVKAVVLGVIPGVNRVLTYFKFWSSGYWFTASQLSRSGYYL